jgi:hypothetical protein
MASLFQTLPDGPLDIIGDVHGEVDALRRLLDRLGCDPEARTVERPLVFVGDLVDRGPNSGAVVALVMGLVEAGVAQCVLGNHELNILLGAHKEGNGWLWRDETDHFQYKTDGEVVSRRFDAVQAEPEDAARYKAFFATLPLVLSRDDLRVVHACWHSAAIDRLPRTGDVAALGQQWTRDIHHDHKARGLWALEKAERDDFADLKRLDVPPSRDLPSHANAAAERQSLHPIKVLTSGQEVRVPFEEAFFVGGKWRFVRRFDWWNEYDEAPAVVVGHYWRRRDSAHVEGKPDAWATPRFTDWAGPRKNVFCVDYSVGRRFLERTRGTTTDFQGGLAALRWPERTLVFDDREGELPTT